MANRRRIDRAERAQKIIGALKRLGRIALRLGALAALIGCIRMGATAAHEWVTTTDRLAIATIDVEGNERASADELRRLAGIAPGTNLLLADLASARNRLLVHPWIEQATVERRFPQGIGIAVVERQAAALVDLGHLYLVDGRGEVFKRVLPGDPVDLPVITGIAREDWSARPDAARQRLDQALQAIAAWKARDRGAHLPVAEVHLDEGEGPTLYLGDRGPAVKLGHGGFERKLDRLQQVLAEAERRGKRLELVRLDNRARPGWIAARLAEEGGAEG